MKTLTKAELHEWEHIKANFDELGALIRAKLKVTRLNHREDDAYDTVRLEGRRESRKLIRVQYALGLAQHAYRDRVDALPPLRRVLWDLIEDQIDNYLVADVDLGRRRRRRKKR